MRKSIPLMAAAALAILIASPASAYVLLDGAPDQDASNVEEGAPEEGTVEEGTEVEVEPTPLPPTKRTESVYLHCAGDVPLDNVSRAQGSVPGWDTAAPSQSVQDGAGCGNIDASSENFTNTGPAAGTPVDQSSSDSFDAVFRGTFAGNLDSLTITMYRIPGPVDRVLNEALAPEWWGAIHLKIDGVTVPLSENAVVAPAEKTNSDVTDTFSVSIDNIGLLVEEGDGTTVRTIELRLDHENPEANGMLVWDTTEVPSGIVFNPGSLTGAVVSAQ